jgi:hypothetical protein
VRKGKEEHVVLVMDWKRTVGIDMVIKAEKAAKDAFGIALLSVISLSSISVVYVYGQPIITSYGVNCNCFPGQGGVICNYYPPPYYPPPYYPHY